MLKQCLENVGDGLLHACISSMFIKYRYKPFAIYIPLGWLLAAMVGELK